MDPAGGSRRGRRERWAQEDDAEIRYTEENDPDLRRNHPEG